MEKATAVRNLVEPALTAKGIDLYDIEFTGGRLLVTVNRAGGIDLEALTEANRIVSALLDEHDPIPDDNYLLEVSSPGLERILRTPEHFAAAVGETVNVKLGAEVEGERRHQGPLEAVDPSGVTVAGRHFAYSQIEKARTVFAWGPTPKKTTKTTNVKAGS